MPQSDPSDRILEILPPVMRAIRAEMRGLAQPELTVAQLRILTRLDHTPQTNKQLAEWMGISAATMSRTVDVLVKHKLVQRAEAESDRREVKLTLTQLGRERFESILSSTKKMLKKKISLLSDSESSQLLNGLELLKKIFFPGAMAVLLFVESFAPQVWASQSSTSSSVTQPVTLKDAVWSAILKTETVSIGQARIRESDARKEQARSRFLPSLSLGASVEEQDRQGLTGSSASLLSGRQTNVRLSVAQSIYEGGRDRARVSAAQSDIDFQNASLMDANYATFTRVAQGFYGILSNQKEVENLEKALSLARSRLTEVRSRAKIGRSQNVEVYAADAQISVLQAQKIAAEGQLVTAWDQFVLLTGLPREVQLLETREAPQPPEPLEKYLARLDQRADIQAIQAQLESVRAGLRIAKGLRLPSVGVTGNLYLERSGPQAGNNWDLGASLALPLYSGGLIDSQIRESREREAEYEALLSQARRQAEVSVRTAYNNLTSAIQQTAALKHALAMTERNFREQEKNYGYGRATNLDVIQALNSFQDSKRTLDRMRFISLSAWAELKAATANVSLARLGTSGQEDSL